MPLIQIIKPAAYPVSVAEVKLAARIDGSEFDAQITMIIAALTLRAESLTGRAFIARTLELVLDAFPATAIDLLKPGVKSITSVKYFDEGAIERVLSAGAYTLDNAGLPCWLMPAVATEWPQTLAAANAVRIRFELGWSDPADVPEDIKLWITAHAVQALQSPDGLASADLRALPFVDALLDEYRIVRAV
jgi:uncharacterized phiE125 gp8 family phage protein